MPHRSNGKHRIPISESKSRISTEVASGSPLFSRVEDGLTEVHDRVVEKATEFIRERPGVSLVLAAAVGGLIGWLIKRRV